jgi:hypothetical protein
MRQTSFRVLVTAAVFSVSAFLLACPLGQLHVLIPDYVTSSVKGVQIYRVDGARLVDAGRIEFLGIETSASGETIKYKQVSPDGAPWFGPVQTAVTRNPSQPASIELTLAYLNPAPAGFFKVASFNTVGTSKESADQAFLIGEEG